MRDQKSQMDDKEFQEKYISKTDQKYGVIFVPKVPGLPVLDSDGKEIINYKEYREKNSFQTFLGFIGSVVLIMVFRENGPYSNPIIKFFHELTEQYFSFFDKLFSSLF